VCSTTNVCFIELEGEGEGEGLGWDGRRIMGRERGGGWGSRGRGRRGEEEKKECVGLWGLRGCVSISWSLFEIDLVLT